MCVHSIPQCFFHAQESSHRTTQHWTQEARTFLIGALRFGFSEQADYPLPHSHRHQHPACFFPSIKDVGLHVCCIHVQTFLDLLRQTGKHRVLVLHKSCTSATVYSINDDYGDDSQLFL
jgi:hypothetical protein